MIFLCLMVGVVYGLFLALKKAISS